jgi:uncharacterized membrane protein
MDATGIVLGLATVAVGMMAGVFAIYSIAVMPGLRRVDDRTFVGAFQAVDRAIVTPVFLGLFLGGAVLPVVAAVLLAGDGGAALSWTVTAIVAYLAVIAITARIHVPRNDALKAAGDPDEIDLPAVRAAFDEQRWATWNIVRASVCTSAFACLVLALVEYGRTL